jgi:hypothetical protein
MVYILNKSHDEIVKNVCDDLIVEFKSLINREYFQNQELNATVEKREELGKICISAIALFVATEIKHLSTIQQLSKSRMREMFQACVDKFLNQSL